MALKMITDNSLREAPLLAARVYGMAPAEVHKGGIIRINNWEEFKQKLQRLRSVSHLVVFMHSIPDGLIIGGVQKDFDTLSYFLGSMPRIDEISLEGCNAGENPRALAALGRVFRAKKIHAFNYFHITQTLDIQIPKNSDICLLRAALQKIKERLPYFARSQGSDADLQGIDKVLKGTPGIYNLLLEWFRNDFDGTPPPPFKPGDFLPMGFKKRSDATKNVLQDRPDLPGADTDPAPSFMRVTIEFPTTSPDRPAPSGKK